MIKKKVLFVCVHNSARSQMAEELLRKIAGNRFDAESAGLEPGKLNPYVIKVLKEEGIDITNKKTKSAFDLLKAGRRYTYVITVCDETSAEACPVFPSCEERSHWSFPDPSKFVGTDDEKIEQVREIKNQIKAKIEEWINYLDSNERKKKLSVL
ncbi:MAG: arsenate reductase ArsC [Thermodesulfobacteriota bacterium]